MIHYINPKNMNKEDWLEENYEEKYSHLVVPDFRTITADRVLVCLVDNGHFTAAAVVNSQGDFDDFNRISDTRYKVWYLIKRIAVKAVCPGF